MYVRAYFGPIANMSRLFGSDWYDTIATQKNIVSNNKLSFSIAIIVGTLESSTKIYFIPSFCTDDARTRMFRFVLFPENWFFYFTTDDASYTQSWFSYDSSPEDFYIFFENTFINTCISFYNSVIREGGIGEKTKRANLYIFSNDTIGYFRTRMYGISLWHGGILVKNFFYPPSHFFAIVSQSISLYTIIYTIYIMSRSSQDIHLFDVIFSIYGDSQGCIYTSSIMC